MACRSGRYVPTFRRNLLPPSFFRLEDEGKWFLQNSVLIYLTTRLHIVADFNLQEQKIHGLTLVVSKCGVKRICWVHWRWRNRVNGVSWFKLPQKKHYCVRVTFRHYQQESLTLKRYQDAVRAAERWWIVKERKFSWFPCFYFQLSEVIQRPKNKPWKCTCLRRSAYYS